MTPNRLFFNVLAILFCTLFLASVPTAPIRSTEEILRSYVEDFQKDPAAAEPMTFGIRISGKNGGEWQVKVGGRKETTGSYQVELREGLPSNPSAVYTLDSLTLRNIDKGEINALTAMGRARASDTTPMDIEFLGGFQPDPSFFARFIPFTFHFWTRGFPETVGFDKQHSREVHGANMVVLYYQKGLRSAWAQIDRGQHVNADPEDQKNPFPTMVIGIKGKAVAKIGGKEVILHAGQMSFIPPGVSHEAWNPYEEPAEIILIMFGEGA
jgi:mannose-6-phosphate isomerase-like protein (cupin superfamily)